MHVLQRAIDFFNGCFSAWEIALPEDLPAPGEVHQIIARGWTIKYLIGSDDRDLYLDYYATHRMTNDRHCRIYADGEVERLPTADAFRSGSSDPVEDARLKELHDQEVRATMKMLNAKGFGIRGDEHFSLLVQRYEQFGEQLGRDIE